MSSIIGRSGTVRGVMAVTAVMAAVAVPLTAQADHEGNGAVEILVSAAVAYAVVDAVGGFDDKRSKHHRRHGYRHDDRYDGYNDHREHRRDYRYDRRYDYRNDHYRHHGKGHRRDHPGHHLGHGYGWRDSHHRHSRDCRHHGYYH